MTKRVKSPKFALVSSVIALVLCLSMLIGTSFAWFTDSVSSAGNIIKSGTLNIDLGIKTADDQDYVSVKENPTKKAFDYDLWEPGYTEWVNAKVYTTGNLALKYTLRIAAIGQVSALADVIDVYYAAEEIDRPATRDLSGLTRLGTLSDVLAGVTIDDTLLPGENDEDFATLALHMQEDAGNEYQNLSIGSEFYIQILATQYTYEADSFDDQYDADAQWPVINLPNPATQGDLPQAAIAGIDASGVGDNGDGELVGMVSGDRVNADTAIEFISTEAPADIAAKDYKDWVVDFKLSFNKDVDGADIYLFGQYGSYAWLGDNLAQVPALAGTLNAGDKVAIIADWLNAAMPGTEVNYNDIVTTVQNFQCALHVENPEAGLVATLELVMYEGATEHVISTFTYAY